MDASARNNLILIRDVTLRDGLQDEDPIDTGKKVEIFEALVAAGVREVELTSFVRPDRVPALADAGEFVSATDSFPEVVRWGLILNQRGAQRALAAGLNHLQFVFSVSESHNQGNAGRSVEQSLDELRSIRDLAGADAKLEVTLATAFGCPYAGAIAPEEVLERLSSVLEAGVDGVGLADTIGTAAPSEVRYLVGRAVEMAGATPIGVHLHDTRGMALANALGAIDAGASRLDASLGGLGGCPFAPGASGNLPIEDLVHALDAEGIPTGIDVASLLDAARLACDATDRVVASHVGIAGPRFVGVGSP